MTAAAVTPTAVPAEHAQSPAASVTDRRTPMSGAERVRQHRERQRLARAQPPIFERADWSLFINPRTLSQKAGCQPAELRRLVLRELVDNALDAGAHVTLDRVDDVWVVADDGPGLDPDEVPSLFSVNRSLRSSKQLRLPTRGMVGNGLRVVTGAVAASDGELLVETRGHSLTLAVDRATGLTEVVQDVPIKPRSGVRVCLRFGPALPETLVPDDTLAREGIRLAGFGTGYRGCTSPWWYSERDLRDLMLQAPPETTVADVSGWFVPGWFDDVDDHRAVRDLDGAAVSDLLIPLRSFVDPNRPARLGHIGPDAYSDRSYHSVTGTTRAAVAIPYVAEAWASCRRSTTKGAGSAAVQLLLNRTPSATRLAASSNPDGIRLQGGGMWRILKGKTGHYNVTISIISPLIELASDGKEPALTPFSEGIVAAVEKACARAHAAMDKPEGSMSIVDAAVGVLPTAYRIASANGTLPANARQIYYAARPFILKLTGRKELIDSYFTQNVLPDYIDTHPDAYEWDVVFDDRGTFTEPHTSRSIGLGTVAVREYLGERPSPPLPASVAAGSMSNTTGPENRYRDVLFIEKEGFNALLSHAMIAARFDLAITSTKGMSVTALRQLLDGLVGRGMQRVFVLHDFDASGFSIFGTLATDSRRYTFTNEVNVIDLGLRLDDVLKMGLPAEPYEPAYWDKRQDTLERHGATGEEIHFLASRRVELNAMPSDVFIRFLERKLVEHGVKKLVPSADVLVAHAHDVIVRALTNKALEAVRGKAEADAAAIELPPDLLRQVADTLERYPAMPWDMAVAEIATKLCGGDL
jgi:hypothetical protein